MDVWISLLKKWKYYLLRGARCMLRRTDNVSGLQFILSVK